MMEYLCSEEPIFTDSRRINKEASSRIKDISINLPLLSQKVKQLSGGQRQAVSIIRALFWEKK